MSRQSRQDDLLELLYGESSPEEAAALRREIAEDDELAAQWSQLQETHQLLRAQIPPLAEPSADVQDQILTAALNAAPDLASRRRNAQRSDGIFRSKTKRNNIIAISGIALAALLVGTYVHNELQNSPLAMSEEEVIFEPIAMAVVDPEEEEVSALAADTFANAPATDTPSETPPPAEPTPSSLAGEELAILDRPAPPPRARQTPAPQRRQISSSPDAPTPAPAAAPAMSDHQESREPSMSRPAASASRPSSARGRASASTGADLALPPQQEIADFAFSEPQEEEDSALEKASKALASGDLSAARKYLDEALASDEELSDEDRERAAQLERTIIGQERQLERTRPASIPTSSF